MDAIRELEALKKRIESQIQSLQGEVETITKTLRIMEREHPEMSPQMLLPVVPSGLPKQPLPNNTRGLSEACRTLGQVEWITPVTVRDHLIETGYPYTDKHNLLSS